MKTFFFFLSFFIAMVITSIISSSQAQAEVIEAQEAQAQTDDEESQTNKIENNPLWGFRCASNNNQTIVNVAIQNDKIINIALIPEIDGQVIAVRTINLKNIAEDRYAALYRPMINSENQNENEKQVPERTIATVIHYEMIFKIKTSPYNLIPTVEQASLKENGVKQIELVCTPLFQKRIKSTITM